MKNITLRADGRYMARKQINGRRITLYGQTENECIKKLKQTKTIIKKLTQQKETHNTLYEWLDNWYTTYKEPFIKEQSSQLLRIVITNIKNSFENTKLKTITTQKIQSTLNNIPQSRKKELITLYLNASLQKAEDLSLIIKNPFKAVVKDQKLNNIRKGYNLEEQKQILTEIQGTQIEIPILLYLITGIRKNEFKTINLETDLDIKNKTIRILNEKKKDGKKTYRIIDLTQDGLNLFLKSKKSLKLKTDFIYREFKTITDRLKIKSGLHRLRHTFATNHFYLKTPVKLISSWLGHTTIELTQNIYTHIDRTITEKDLNKLYNNLYFKV